MTVSFRTGSWISGAGGTVESHFPGLTSWSQLNDQQWETMAYQSMNSLGFVGFQFGEALLIDLGYYDDSAFYGNGAATNTWDGTWTGKNGVASLEDFTTKEAQTVAIQEAFGYQSPGPGNAIGRQRAVVERLYRPDCELHAGRAECDRRALLDRHPRCRAFARAPGARRRFCLGVRFPPTNTERRSCNISTSSAVMTVHRRPR